MTRRRPTEQQLELMAATCRGKQAYPTATDAWRALHGLHGRTPHKGRKRHNLEVYRCPVCHLWHLGRPTGQERW
jgi:hypothetical protein